VPAGVVAYGRGVEESGFDAHGYVAEFVAGLESYGAIIAHLFAHERTVGEYVCSWSAKRFHAKWHSELSGLKEDVFGGCDARISVKNFHFTLVAQVGLNEIICPRSYFSVKGDAGVADLKSVFAIGSVYFQPCTQHAMNVWCVINFLGFR